MIVVRPIDPKQFRWMVEEAFATKELVRGFDRLRGTSLTTQRLSPIEVMVDEATGHDIQKQEHDLRLFVEFVREFIYDRLVPLITISIYPHFA